MSFGPFAVCSIGNDAFGSVLERRMAYATRPCTEDFLSAGETWYRLAAVRVDASQAAVFQALCRVLS